MRLLRLLSRCGLRAEKSLTIKCCLIKYVHVAGRAEVEEDRDQCATERRKKCREVEHKEPSDPF